MKSITLLAEVPLMDIIAEAEVSLTIRPDLLYDTGYAYDYGTINVVSTHVNRITWSNIDYWVMRDDNLDTFEMLYTEGSLPASLFDACVADQLRSMPAYVRHLVSLEENDELDYDSYKDVLRIT